MNWKKILKNLKKWEKEDRKLDDAVTNFVKEMAPNEFSPIIMGNCVSAYLEGLDLGDKEVEDWLTYWLYEVPTMESEATVTDKKTEYDFKKEKDVIKFLKEIKRFRRSLDEL